MPSYNLQVRAMLALAGLCSALPVHSTAAAAANSSGRVSLHGTAPASVSRSQREGPLSDDVSLSAAFTLPLRNQPALRTFLSRVSNPKDALYGHYLTPAQFTAEFGPTQDDYDAVAAFAQSQGLSVVGRHANRLVLDVSGSAAAMQSAFGVHLNMYRSPEGREFYAPDTSPTVPAEIAGRISGVVGLDNAAVRHPHLHRALDPLAAYGLPREAGSGPQGGLTPSDIRAAYDLSSVAPTGSGQTLAVFEFDGYTPSDITTYESAYGLPNIPLQNVLIDGVTGTAGSDADETTLDIELVMALAPGASKVLVYEGPNTTDAATLDIYNQIAVDDAAQEISTSWGLDEQENDSAFLNNENSIFQEMAAQGQTIYAAAGDSGAYDSGSVSDGLRVDDPGSQPYVCAVGGTTLQTQGPGGAWVGETTWNSGSVRNGASGGGISSVWPIPSWQQGEVSTASLGSTTMRNVPDVSLDADPNSGYSIYYSGAWTVYGGASTAAPLWAGFTALVNQQRATAGLGTLGQASPSLYAILKGSHYNQDFHDIADGSNNLFYPAVTGYDDATGLGTMIGAHLLADLAPSTSSTALVTYTAGLNFVALPYDYSSDTLADVLGYSSPTLFVWSPTTLQYVLTPTAPADTVRIGQGYWANFPQAVTVTKTGTPASTSAAYAISLSVGWNQIGDPFPTAVPISGFSVGVGGQNYTFANASGTAALIGSVFYGYNPSSGAYVTLGAGDSLEPGQGYWIHASQAATLSVSPP